MASAIMTELLISVRSAAEAAAALAGGAAVIDVKEPSRGPLGRADDAVIAAVFDTVAGRAAVSAAQGELLEGQPLPSCWEPLTFLKWGLADCRGIDWRSKINTMRSRVGARLVIAAYADAQLADAPVVAEISEFIGSLPPPRPILLIDTWDKNPPAPSTRPRNLLDWFGLPQVDRLIKTCRHQNVRIALAGSLGRDEIERLAPLLPDWIAVRGAACDAADRTRGIVQERVRSLVLCCRGLR